MARWVPSTEDGQFRVRVWKRLIQNGVPPMEIAKTWNCVPHLIYQATGGLASAERRKAKEMRSRVWSRLTAEPFRMTQTTIAEIWGLSCAKVSIDIRCIRFETPKLMGT